MTKIPKAWVWDGYRGVVLEGDDGNRGSQQNPNVADDRVVHLNEIRNSRSKAMGQNASNARTKFGLAIAASILVGAFFKLIALALFLIAVLLAVSGKEPQKTQEFLGGVPGGDYIIKALARVDSWLF